MRDYQKALKQIRAIGGSNAKTSFLKKFDSVTLRSIIYYTYHPTLSYYIKKTDGCVGEGTVHLDESFNWICFLTSSNLRQISGDHQKAMLKSIMRELTREDAEIFKLILSRDLALGVGLATIAEAFPGLIPEFGFMKAKKYVSGDIAKKGPMYASVKIDCIRGLLRDGVIYSSGGKPIDGVQHIAQGLPKGLELDGEMTIPDMDFNAASGFLRSKKDCPTAVFRVFDIPSDKPFEERYDLLKEVCEMNYPGISLVKHILVKSDDKVAELFVKAIDAKFEGLVLKTPKHPYQLKRSSDWLKVKAEDPDDVTIVGFKEGTGKYAGSLGAVECRRDNGVIVDVSGFTESMKHEIWNNQEKWLNKIIAIKYHEETPDGSLRHPRFDRVRWDKQ